MLSTLSAHGNVLLCCKEMYLLLMKCFIIFLISIQMVGRASDSIWAPNGPQCVVSANNKSQISCKISVFGYPLSNRNATLCYKGRHQLLLDYFISLLNYISIVGRASCNLHESLLVHNNVIPAINKHQISCKFEILNTLSAHEMCCCAERSGIYCWWSDS